jgi:2-dehydropantoate 2-reductase
MRICVVGAGAIGGLLALRLARAGEQVAVVARGAQLAAVREQGLRLRERDQSEWSAPLAASDRCDTLGPQDIVLLAVKAHQLPAVAPELSPLLAPDTLVVTAQNGVPWWYFDKLPGPYAGQRLESVDPGGVIARHIAIERVLGLVVYPAAELVRPGLVQHIEGDRFSVGELDGSRSERAQRLSRALHAAGFKAPVVKDIRSEIWLKLWGNCSFNPLSALTHATLAELCRFAPTRALVAEMMREAQAVGEKLGVRFLVSLERRIAGAQAVGEHKTSMLQDMEHGRTLELEALLGSVLELGRITNTPTPHLTAIYACTRLLEQTLLAQRSTAQC